MLSQICQEFGCLPSQALKEPAETLLRVRSLRSYARAKQAVALAESEADVTEEQKAAVFDVVAEITGR